MWDDGLTDEQVTAAGAGDGPLIVIAGAGTGKTRTLTARVGALLERGVAAERILLLTFTRRAADDMLARALALAGQSRRPWGGTFHSVAYRLVAAYAGTLGLPAVSVLDPADAATLMELVCDEQGLGGTDVRLPRPAVLVDAYSRAVNTGRPLRSVLDEQFPWCAPHADALTGVMRGYVARKRSRGLLDFDDLLLGWRALLLDATAGAALRALWDHVLVDEYQDVNQVQVDIVRALRPDGTGLTVVGDDAQAIYGFRGCNPGHLHDVAATFPRAMTVALQQNFRSRQPVLDVANAVRPTADGLRLHAARGTGTRPQLVRAHDAADEARSVCEAILAAHLDGCRLREQAVLMRAAHHSDLLEVELSARRIPYRKYGGLRFLDAAHVKDFVACLRLLANPHDELAWLRALRLHHGVGTARARALADRLVAGTDIPTVVAEAPARSRVGLQSSLDGLAAARAQPRPANQAAACLRVLEPLAHQRYPDAPVRLADLARLVDASAGVTDLAAYAADLAIDPPASSSDRAGPPGVDEDYVVLSTVHSAKGLEWSRVHVIGLVDGAFPSDMALRTPDGLAEEQRLFYVAVTRARDQLSLHVPLRMPHRRRGSDDRHSLAPASRFLDTASALCETVERTIERPAPPAGLIAARVALPTLEELWA